MIAEVIVDISASDVDKVFEYSFSDPAIKIGSRVLVPFGNRKIEGYVLKIKENPDIDPKRLKEILCVKDDFAVITKEQFSLMERLREKYNYKIVDILRLFLPSGLRQGKVGALSIRFAELNEGANTAHVPKNAKAQRDILAYLEEIGSVRVSELNNTFGYQAVKALEKKGLIVFSEQRKIRKPYANTGQKTEFHKLLPAQQSALKTIMSLNECLDQNTEKHGLGSNIVLLHGVTGSGKTEVYINCILECIKKGKTAIMLVPEISLTPQMLRVFRERFEDKVALLHSGLSMGERFDEWCRLMSGEAQIAIGARSAVFAPLKNLGVIIIDEEHDSSYISETNPRYFTHEIAKFRATYNNAVMILGSATPSVESYYKAKKGEYKLLTMPERINKKRLPEVRVVDMTKEVRNGNLTALSALMRESLDKTLKAKSQAIIFLNRRGFAAYQMCRVCGHVVKCDFCDVSMVYHREENVLKCHYCSNRRELLNICPECASKSIRYGAAGTEKIVEEIQTAFPTARILRLDNDTTRTKDAHQKILSAFREREADILVGTQMVAKGHDFPYVTFVGIIDADLSLYVSDFRSAERTFQLITQVSGRAGRAELDGEVVLQTYNPRHYAYRYAVTGDYKSFFEKEINTRDVTKYPPFARILRVSVSSESEELALETLKSMSAEIRSLEEKYKDSFIFFKAMRSPVKKIQSRHRVQALIRICGENTEYLTTEIFRIAQNSPSKDVLSFCEINPQSLS